MCITMKIIINNILVMGIFPNMHVSSLGLLIVYSDNCLTDI